MLDNILPYYSPSCNMNKVFHLIIKLLRSQDIQIFMFLMKKLIPKSMTLS